MHFKKIGTVDDSGNTIIDDPSSEKKFIRISGPSGVKVDREPLTLKGVGKIFSESFDSAVKETRQEALGMATGLTGGLVQGGIEEISKRLFNKNIELPRGSKRGQMVGAVSPGGLIGRGGLLAASAIPAKTGKRLLRKAFVGGGVSGVLAPTLTDETGLELERRLAVGAISAPFSVAVSATLQTGNAFVQAFRASKKLKDVTRRINEFFKSPQKAEAEQLESLKNRALEMAEDFVAQETRITEFQIKEAASDFANELRGTTTKIRPLLRRNLAVPSQRYGSTLDAKLEVAEAIAKKSPPGQRTGITIDDVLEAQSETIQELRDSLLDTPEILAKIKSATRLITGKLKPSGILDQFGRPVEVPRTDFVDLKSFIKGRRALSKALSSPAKLGTKKFTPEDVALSIYQRNLGQRLEKVIDIKELNIQYGEFVDLQKFIFKNFRPGTGRFDTKAARTFLKNLGLKPQDFTAEDFMAMSKIEGGTDLFPGIGPASRSVRLTGANAAAQQKLAASRILEAEQRVARRLAAVNQQLSRVNVRNRKLMESLRLEKIQLDELTGALKLSKRVGTVAAFGAIQGLTSFMLFRMLFGGKSGGRGDR